MDTHTYENQSQFHLDISYFSNVACRAAQAPPPPPPPPPPPQLCKWNLIFHDKRMGSDIDLKENRKKKKKNSYYCRQMVLNTSYSDLKENLHWLSLETKNTYKIAWLPGNVSKNVSWMTNSTQYDQPFVYFDMGIAPYKVLFQQKRINIFLIYSQKHMLWVFIRSASARRF